MCIVAIEYNLMEQFHGFLARTLFSRDVIIFGIDYSSSSHTDNCKNNFSVLGE